MMEEDELAKSEIQDDIGGEFSLFPCCKLCKSPENLFAHIKQHHEKDATKCELCGKELSSKSSLDRHLLIHARWQPYKCNHCDKQFSTNGNMHRHKKTHKGLCKGSKFMKEEHKLNKECSPMKNSKRNSRQGINVNIKTENTAALYNTFSDLCNIKSEKRKSSMDEILGHESPVKRIKPSCIKNARSVDGNSITDIASNIVSLNTEHYSLRADSQPDGNKSADDKTSFQTSSNISSLPSKEEFITTLGLKTACRLETKTESNGVSNIESEILFGNFQPHKDEHIASEKSLNVDLEKKQSLDKNIIKLHQRHITQRENLMKLSALASRIIAIEQSDLPFKDTVEVNNNKIDGNSGKVDSHPSNVDKHWLPESPETSSEGNLFKPLLSAETFKKCKEDELQSQYFCKHCKKEFKSRIIFREHLVKHNKRKPFKCNICGKKFLSKQNATRHVMKVHKKKRIHAKLLIVENLDDPPNVGAKILCEWCSQEFTSSLILEHHKRAFTGCQAKPFKCEICNKSFSTKNNGKRHQFQHHKDKQDDCCIVPNIIPKISEDTSSQLKIVDTSTTSIVAVDASRESSVKSPLSSESENPDESECSVPKKIMDAAQSLLNMSSGLPLPRSSGIIIDQPDVNASPPLQGNSGFYLHMPVPVNVQNKPLDLSVHPMDLSSKSNEDYDRVKVNEFKRLPIFPFPILSKDRNSDTGIFHVNNHNYISSDTPLNLVKNEHSSINHFISSMNPSLSFPSTSFELSNCSSIETDEMNQKESNSPKPSTSYKCNLCTMSFTTNSNKRRHEKTKHHMHCKVPQSTKISFGFCNLKDEQMTSTPKTVLSKKTKEALITKVSSVKSVEFEPVDFSVNNGNEMIQPLAIINNESENGDLASLPSLMKTANITQLKKYLTADNVCDATADLDVTQEEVEEEKDLPKTVDQISNSKKSSNEHWCGVCQKQFTCKSSFNRHSVIHTKKRDHHCQECKKTFTTKSNRDRHMKKVHRIMLSRDSKKPFLGRKQQKKPVALVPSEAPETEMDIKDLTLPKDMVNSEISQCNKENQRLFMPS